MGYNATVLLTTCYRAPAEISELNFFEVETDNEHLYQLNGKIRVDDVLNQLTKLNWTRTAPSQIHHILWADDYTSEDDSMGGRITPLQWHHARLVIPLKGPITLEE